MKQWVVTVGGRVAHGPERGEPAWAKYEYPADGPDAKAMSEAIEAAVESMAGVARIDSLTVRRA